MKRRPLRLPNGRLPKPFECEDEDGAFLDLIKPWNTDQYKEKAGSPNNNFRIRVIKEDIRQKLILIQDNYCAICGIDLKIARGPHREHIAPQAQYEHYIFEKNNIVLTCYDCNDFKGTKNVVNSDPTGSYDDVDLRILHPHRDNFGEFILADMSESGLIFHVIDGITDIRAKNTINDYGLADLRLIAERGMRIKNTIKLTDGQVKELISITDREVRYANQTE